MRVILVCYGHGAVVIIRAFIRWVVDPTIPYGKCIHLMGPTGRGKGCIIAFLISLLDSRITSSLMSPAVLSSVDKLHQFAVGKRLIAYPDVKVDSCRTADLSLFYENVENAPQTPRKLFASQAEESCPLFNRSIIGSVGPLQFPQRQGFDRRTLCLQTAEGDGSPNPEDPSLKEDLLEGSRAAEIRSKAVSWAMEMPLDEVLQVLNREDPEGLLLAGQEASRSDSDSVSRFIDKCLVPHQLGPAALVTDLDWLRIYAAYRGWATKHGYTQLLLAHHLLSQVREALPGRCRGRRKESMAEAAAAGRGRNQRLNISATEHGFQLVPGILGHGEMSYDPIDFNPLLMRRGGLDALRELPPLG
jgi:hypothetical protein